MTENVPTYTVPATSFPTPTKPLVGGKPYSVLQDSEREVEFNSFRKEFALAISPPPDVNNFADPAEYMRQTEQYTHNRYRLKIEEISAQCQVLYDKSSEKAVGKQKADDWYKKSTQALANEYMGSLDIGAKNPEVEATQKTAFQQLLKLDFRGALQTFIMTMPPVAAFLRSIWSKFTGENLSYADARKQMRREEAYSGLAVAMGAKDQASIDAFVAQRKEMIANSSLVQKPPTVELDTEFNNDANKARREVQAAIAAGNIILQGDKYFATENTVIQLDKTLPDLKKQGASIAKVELAPAVR